METRLPSQKHLEMVFHIRKLKSLSSKLFSFSRLLDNTSYTFKLLCEVNKLWSFSAADIKDLKIIESRPEPAEPTHSTVAVTKNNKKGQRATVCENLQANPTNSGNFRTFQHFYCTIYTLIYLRHMEAWHGLYWRQFVVGNQLSLSVGPSTSRAQNARGPGSAPAPPRSKPIDIQGNRSNKNNNHAGV